MIKYRNYIGVDVSKKTLDICILQDKKVVLETRINNTAQALTQFARKLKKQGYWHVNAVYCFEKTGIYSLKLIDWCVKTNQDMWIENPMQIKKSMGLVRGKSDRIDARNIASYAYRFRDICKLWTPPRKELKELADLYTSREMLVKAKKSIEANGKENTLFRSKSSQKSLVSYTKKTILAIKVDIKNIDLKIDMLIQNDAELKRIFNIIISVKGIGKATAVLLLIVTDEFKKLHNVKKIACFIGIAPFPYSSGTSVRGRTKISHMGYKPLKSLLHMCAISSIRTNPEMSAYFKRKVEGEKKHAMTVLNAIRYRLLARVCACVRNNRKYEKSLAAS